MTELEHLFRWAIYIDYRTSPERLIGTIRNRIVNGLDAWHDTAMINVYSRITECSTAQISRSHFVLSINEFLLRYRQEIMDEAQSKGVDGRAIAAAITWEFRENLKGRYSDYWQAVFPGKTSGIGWGSMHTQEALRLMPGDQSLEAIACIRMDAVTIIPLVAKFMKDCIDLYFSESNGIYIGSDPALIAFFYNTGLKKVKGSARTRKRELDALNYSPMNVELKVGVNPMAKWVKDNLGRFEKFKTEPKTPARVRTVAISS